MSTHAEDSLLRLTHRPPFPPDAAFPLPPRLRELEERLREAYERYRAASPAETDSPAAAEWLLDNFYVVQRAIRQTREHMSKGYYQELPKMETTAWKGHPRIFALAFQCFEAGERPLDAGQVVHAVEEVQRHEPLTMGELWALATMLRLTVLERLAEALGRLVSAGAPETLESDEAVVANSITSLHALAGLSWQDFFESVSQVEKILREDPPGVYGKMDFKTRDVYRKRLEELSKAVGRGETEVARETLRLAEEAKAAKAGPARASHVGFYLLDAGLERLEERLGGRLGESAPWRRSIRAHKTALYLGAVALGALLLVTAAVTYVQAAGGGLLALAAAGLLAVVPAVILAADLVNGIVTHSLSPRPLPKMDFRKKVPARYRTLVTVPCLLTSPGEVDSLFRQLELHYLGNGDSYLYFALLSDFADAPSERVEGDDALLAQAEAGIRRLNQVHARNGEGPFFLLHRRRKWNPGEGCWMGWERKRGKLVELNRLLQGKETTFEVQIGDLDVLPKIRYCLTLDADTTLPRSAARRLIATLAHPLNRAEVDPRTGEVLAGYTILQPRVQVEPTSAGRSAFTRIFSRDTGLDLYTRAVSNVYQDLFAEGSYVGKGLYDVAAFERTLDDRVPDNTLLSHDLFEGLHGRSALVTDVVLFEDYPPHFPAYVRRSHRWIRGDWQLLPWLLPRVPHRSLGRAPNRLSALSRWKITDNLLRSLLTPASLVLLLAGWFWLPGPAWVWTAAGILPVASPVLVGHSFGWIRRLRARAAPAATPGERADVLRLFLAVVFLLHEALSALDAVTRTLVRLAFTRRHLLQWTSAAHTVRALGQELYALQAWRRMAASPLLAAVASLGLALLRPEALASAAPLLLLWCLSPGVAWWIARPERVKPADVTEEDRHRLHRLARQTWFFFESYVGPEDHWLPPDHFQEDPRGLAAHRTSPTNVGLLLLSTGAAFDLGYLGPVELSLRWRGTLEEMRRLERHRGHFLNWYETRGLDPLPPRYVSVVDSGNLAACLLTLERFCEEIPSVPVLRWERWQGLLDTLDVLAEIGQQADFGPGKAAWEARLRELREAVAAVRGEPSAWPDLLGRLCGESCRGLEEAVVTVAESDPDRLDAETLHRLHAWIERARHHLTSFERHVSTLLPWARLLSRPPALFTEGTRKDAWRALVEALPSTPRLNEITRVRREAVARLAGLRDPLVGPGTGVRDALHREADAWCFELARVLESADNSACELLGAFRGIRDTARTYSDEMKFGFLFDRDRKVFHIGYNVDAGKLDANHYDLLASEARLASIVAIAKGDVPQSHWLHLSRPQTKVRGRRALLSWSGTMFEYLMPSLLMRSDRETALGQSSRAAVEGQIAYGRRRGVPWGVSESGYYAFDAQMNYQYRAFGVPRLGFKRGLAEDLVVAPYASMLALSLRPQAVMKNVARLLRLGMLGPYGFYEAIDFTPSRLGGRRAEIVRSYMAHHQGMILLAVVNFLQDEPMVRRFHANPWVRSVEILLHEQVSLQAPLVRSDGAAEREDLPGALKPGTLEPWEPPSGGTLPQAHVLSNGSYEVLLTSGGGGYSRFQGVELTRWRPDVTLDDRGTWIYVRDLETGELWSVAHQPAGVRTESRQVLFFPHQVEIQRGEHDVTLRLAVTVAPGDAVEIRRVSLVNHSDRRRRLAVTSYAEVALADRDADRRHPAFTKLFVESEHLPELNGLLFRRRPRSDDEKPVYLVHLVTSADGRAAASGYESDRSRFLGRGGSARRPAALRTEGGLGGGTGAVLDPVMALDQVVELEPHASAELAFLTLAAETCKQALELARTFRNWTRVGQAFDQARARSQRELAQLQISARELRSFQQLLSALLFPHSPLRAEPAVLAANVQGQSGLWPFSISGDEPILLVRVSGGEQTGIVRAVLKAQAFWRHRGLAVDLVLLSREESSYESKLTGKLRRLVRQAGAETWLGRRGGVFLLGELEMQEDDRVLLLSAARVVLDGDRGSLAEQLEPLLAQPAHLPRFVAPSGILAWQAQGEVTPSPEPERPEGLLFDNGLGGFRGDGKEYVIYLEPGRSTPAPWINVISNPRFGFLVSEAGSGFTWAENSGENRLTSWHNDPLTDPPGEALYLRDEETGEVWSPTPSPARAESPYLIRHGAGYSTFEHGSHGLRQHLCLFAAPEAPVKVIRLRLENPGNRNRRVSVTYYAEWVLGTSREVSAPFTVSEFDAKCQALLVRNPYDEDLAERIAFLTCTREIVGLTADRTEFLGRMGDYARPAALERMGLTARVAPGPDPCAALQSLLWLAPHEQKEITFLLGQGKDREEAFGLIETYQRIEEHDAAWDRLTRLWDEVLGAVTVETPDPAMDLMLNRWLLYQALSCRLWGRSALYQSSGAFGFRDQLQDVLALVHARPEIAAGQILLAAGRQFEEGDVLHWWHPPAGRGVRSRCSDDLLWLPYVTERYVASTGDYGLLDETVPYLEGPELAEGEDERYNHYAASACSESLYEHCLRALERGSTRGSHGLPLIGLHDWNDGMNRIGVEGRGESVWLGWFLYAILTRFADLCERKDDGGRAAEYRHRARGLRDALDAAAWDGAWFRRAYDDDGVPLGSAGNRECQIDSIAQSWAVLSGAAGAERARRAMASVAERLVRTEDRLILLFDPPFDRTRRDPGYVKGYLPGVRENGGQYTHAALWTVWAFAELGDADRAEALFRMINPIYHADTPEKVERYRVEPYVVAADVYSRPPHVGRGGWTWYTGSAAWMYRVGLEAILGLRREGQVLRVDPCIPEAWPGFRASYRFQETTYHIHVERPEGVRRGGERILLDGVECPEDGGIPLVDDGGVHEVRVLSHPTKRRPS